MFTHRVDLAKAGHGLGNLWASVILQVAAAGDGDIEGIFTPYSCAAKAGDLDHRVVAFNVTTAIIA
mgnify:CR=1 FL=1